MSGRMTSKIDNGNDQITEIGVGTISVGRGRSQEGDKNAVGPIYRSKVAKTSWPTIPNVTTLFELFERSVRNNPGRRCIGWRPVQGGRAGPYTYHTYKETQGCRSWRATVFPSGCASALSAASNACLCYRKSQECCVCPKSSESWPSW